MNKYKSVGLTKKYKNYRKKKIVSLREECDPPLAWNVIGQRFGISSATVIYMYKEAKDEQKRKKE